MKVKVSELFAAQPALQELVGKEMGARFAFRLARVVRQVNLELESAAKIRRGLIDRLFGPPDKKSGGRTLLEKHKEEWEKELGELMSTEIGFSFARIAVGDLPDLTLGTAMALEWLVDTSGEEGDDDNS